MNRGDIILPHAVMTGGLGGGEAQFLYTDQTTITLEASRAVSSEPGTDRVYRSPELQDCVFYGKLETADGNGGGVLVGGPGYMDRGLPVVGYRRQRYGDRKLTAGSSPYGALRGSTGLIKGIRDGYYAVSGLETGADRREAAFVPWSLVESGELPGYWRWRRRAQEFWTQKEAYRRPASQRIPAGGLH